MNLKKEIIEDIKYIVLGIVCAYLLNFGLGLALGTDLPVVAVVSESMTHDITTEFRHYEFLENNLDYAREEIDSWPLNNGFRKGDVLVVKGISDDNLKVGDVIVYNIQGQKIPIVHRVIKLEDNQILTKGDHNPGYDPWKVDIVRGKAIFVIPYLGWPKLLLTQLLVFLR